MMKTYLICISLFVMTCLSNCKTQQGLTVTAGTETLPEKKATLPGKTAIAAVGEDENAEISDIAGRAPYFLLFDGEGNFLKSIKNPALNMRGGASSEVVRLLIKESCKTMIAGQFGNKMQSQLDANDITYYQQKGNAKNAIETFLKNR